MTHNQEHGRSRSYSNTSRSHSASQSRSRSRSTSIRNIAINAKTDHKACTRCEIIHQRGEVCPTYICCKCNDIGTHYKDNCPHPRICGTCKWWVYPTDGPRCPCKTFDRTACLWCGSNDCEYGAFPAKDWKDCDHLRVSNRAQTPGGGQHRCCRWTLYNPEVQLIEECGPCRGQDWRYPKKNHLNL